MKTSTFRTAATSVGAVLLLTLTACSGGGNASAGTDPDDLPKGPLDEMFEEMYGEYDEDQGARDMMRVEEIVAECMAEEGFEYIPVDQTQFTSFSSDELDVEWGTLEFAEQYGYGATTNPWGGGEGEEEQPVDEEQPEFVDPNQEAVEAMSATEQEAYYAALYGNQEYVEGEEEVEWDWTTAGCQGLAQHEVYEGGNGMGKGYNPGESNTLIYLNANETGGCKTFLERVEKSGGSVTMQVFEISPEIGFCGFFTDCEGNRMAVHSSIN